MPKLIDYPRTTYAGAWELAEIVDDTGGKCAIDTAARKLDRKVSGSFKAIIGSAVKFGLMTSKRELLTTTTLFKRIKHAYDKQEELQFHREAFLTPPLFTQLCRKFRNRELPVQMLDVMLIREFGVEEINAQGVAKAFVEGCRMCSIMDEHNIVGDIDSLNIARSQRRELASPVPTTVQKTTFTLAPETAPAIQQGPGNETESINPAFNFKQSGNSAARISSPITNNQDAIATLFGFESSAKAQLLESTSLESTVNDIEEQPNKKTEKETAPETFTNEIIAPNANTSGSTVTTNILTYQLQMNGPGINTNLEITDEADVSIAIALLEKIRRQFRS